MKKLLLSVIGACSLVMSPAYAFEDDAFEVSANVSAVSKYMWRGWNLNDELSVQGGFDLGYKGFYTGLWGGTDEAQGTEYDVYLGWAGEINEHVSVDAGFIQYRYPSTDVEVEEWHLTVDVNYFSVTYHIGEDDYDYLEINKTFEINDDWSLDLHAGFEDNGSKEWTDYQIMLSYQINDEFSVFIAGSDKERNDSEIWVGLNGNF